MESYAIEMPVECKYHKYVGKLSKERKHEIYEICLEGQINRDLCRKPTGTLSYFSVWWVDAGSAMGQAKDEAY